jgi:hypothetical protein
MYFSCANNVNAHTMRYQIVEEVPLSELKIFQWKGKGVGASRAHFVKDEEWNYTFLSMYTNMEEVKTYFDKMYWRSREQHTMKQLVNMREDGRNSGPSFVKWFRQYVIYLPILYFIIID